MQFKLFVFAILVWMWKYVAKYVFFIYIHIKTKQKLKKHPFKAYSSINRLYFRARRTKNCVIICFEIILWLSNYWIFNLSKRKLYHETSEFDCVIFNKWKSNLSNTTNENSISLYLGWIINHRDTKWWNTGDRNYL